MTIQPVATFRSPLKEKFGLPRQAGLAKSLPGEIVFESPFCREEAVRGLEGFSHIWIIWAFDRNNPQTNDVIPLTVRPPRLGGNRKVGVFASRSPFRPNGLGLSVVKIEEVLIEQGIIRVSGADLADGTPIFDIKPYVPYSDSIPEALGGFTQEVEWNELSVEIDKETASRIPEGDLKAITEILSLDPRPQYQNDPEREYGLSYGRFNIRFRVNCGTLTVVSLTESDERG